MPTDHETPTETESPPSVDGSQTNQAPVVDDGQSPPPGCPVVGIGASAGGLQALLEFFKHLPGDTGMAFVLVQHLDPTHASKLVEILSRESSIPVVEVTDRMAVSPNRLSIIAPNTSLTLDGDLLRVVPRDGSQYPHFAIDEFLRSLAKSRPKRSIGVILSGTGSDGSEGLVAVKSRGGITFAQNDSAEFSGMPRSAVKRGGVTFVLAPKAIAQAIAKIAERGFPPAQTLDLSQVVPSGYGDDQDSGLPSADREPFAAIVEALRTKAGIDFTRYRQTTIRRRVIRRMNLTANASVAEYARFLASNPDEMPLLVKDILINVTRFFRDQPVYDALKTTVFAELPKNRQPDNPIRIWVIGCSTGQEVYSLGIELLDYLKDMKNRPPIQIFASDISDSALAKARAGLYPDSIVDEVPPDRLQRYFTKEEHGYRIDKGLRNLCIFAKHDVTAETPFSKLDFISCRNVLIYLQPALQRHVFTTMHFALKPGGFLLLGSSEAVGRSSNLFDEIDDKNRIYRRGPAPDRSERLDFHSRRAGVPFMTDDRPSPPPPEPSLTDVQRTADRFLLKRFAPAGVLVTDNLQIIQFRGHTNPYLEPAPGEASHNLLVMVPFGVALALKEAMAEAKQRHAPVRRERVVHRRDQASRAIAFEVIPVSVAGGNVQYFLILFEEQSQPARPADVVQPAAVVSAPAGEGASSGETVEMAQIRQELDAAADYIQSLIEHNNSLADQLKASQEEALSSTEEFRSTNEELQTAKEEVESANEELVTLNDELRRTNQHLEQSGNETKALADLTQAIIESIPNPLLLLSAELKVLKANRAFFESFHADPASTLDREIYQLGNGQWDIPELRRLLEQILPKKSEINNYEVTHEFENIGQKTMLVNARRLLADGDSKRIVVVFDDISRRAKELGKLSDELMRSNSDLDQFATVASHDLQEPLRMIQSYADLLNRKWGSNFDDQGRQYIDQISSAGKRMSGMIKAILEYSRLGHKGASKRMVDSSLALHGAIQNLAQKIKDAKAAIIDGPMPHVLADPDQLTQLFQNLLSNAIKFCGDDRAPVIHASSAESDQEWTFSVADNGIGIDLEYSPHMFRLFERLHPADKYPGSGIGLATCRKIVEHHGGRIWVESKPGAGSTFYFSLPKR